MGLTKKETEWIEGLNESLKKDLSAEYARTVSRLEGTITSLKEDNAQLKDTTTSLKEDNARLRERLIEFDIRCDDLEQYGRRMAVRVEGLPWNEGETNVELEGTLIKEFALQGVKIESSDIVRLHRSSRPKEKNGKVYKQCIVKLSNWRAREKFGGYNKKARQYERSKKKTTVRVINDLTRRRLTLLTDARNRIANRLVMKYTPEEIENLADGENIFTYANINSDLKMRVRGKVLSYNSIPELDACIAEAFPEED